MELNQELQGILNVINNMPDDKLFDKHVLIVDEIPAPQGPSQSPAAVLPRRVIYDPFFDDWSIFAQTADNITTIHEVRT